MKINWKAVVIGAVAFIVLGLALGQVHELLVYVGWLLGGVVAVYVDKSKSVGQAAMTGLVAGLAGGVVDGLIVYALIASVGNVLGLGASGAAVGAAALLLFAILGVITGAIGGVIGSFVVGKKKK